LKSHVPIPEKQRAGKGKGRCRRGVGTTKSKRVNDHKGPSAKGVFVNTVPVPLRGGPLDVEKGPRMNLLGE